MIRFCGNTISKSSYSFKARHNSSSKFYDNKKSADVVEFSTSKPKKSNRKKEITFAAVSAISWGVSRIKMDAGDVLDAVFWGFICL